MATKSKPKVAIFANCGIGNFLMYTPFIQAVKRWWNAEIDILIGAKSKRMAAVTDICERANYVTRVIPIPSDEFKPDTYRQIFWSHHNDHDTGLRETMVDLSRHDNCIVMPVWKWKDTKVHEVEYYMNFLFDLGYKGPIPGMSCPRAPQPKLMKHKGLTVAFCNGAYAQKLWDKKKWPIESWIELKRILKNYCDAKIIAVGGENLVEEHRAIKPDIDYTNKITITETAAVLSQCDLAVMTDTGPMHIMAALDRPLIALFGSTHQSKNRPWIKTQRKCRIIQHREMDCVPCQDTDRFHECESYQCMQAITPAEVMHEIRGLVNYGVIRVRSV